MDTLIVYILKSSLSLAVFYLLYMCCLRKDTFLHLRRFYLLFVIGFSLIFPTISFEFSSSEIVGLPAYFAKTIIVTFDQEVAHSRQLVYDFGWKEVVLLISLSVSTILLFRFFRQLYLLYKLKNRNSSEYFGAYRLIKIDDPKGSSFSFFGWIFLHAGDKTSEDIEEVVAHEKMHVNQMHTLDIVACELLFVFFW